MQSFITIELARVNKQVVVVVDGDVAAAEKLAVDLRALDPRGAELWRVRGGVAFSGDKVLYSLPSPRAILDDVRTYIASQKAESAGFRYMAARGLQ